MFNNLDLTFEPFYTSDEFQIIVELFAYESITDSALQTVVLGNLNHAVWYQFKDGLWHKQREGTL
jgi:hypothetical protein